jgi:NitT/TauT family transport system substrate-binding protein
MTMVIDRYKAQDTWAKNPTMDSKAMDQLQKIIQTAGELEKPVDSEKLITRTFAEKSIETIKK